MVDIISYLNRLTQQQFDDWIACRLKVSDLVIQHPFLAKMYRNQILNAINSYTPEQILQMIEQNRPDLYISDNQAAIAKIRREFETIRNLLR